MGSANFSWEQCVALHTEHCHPGKLSQALVSTVLIGAQSHGCGGPPTGLTLSPGPSRGGADATWPKGPTLNRIMVIDCLKLPKVPR